MCVPTITIFMTFMIAYRALHVLSLFILCCNLAPSISISHFVVAHFFVTRNYPKFSRDVTTKEG
jgi:hypothetical protein